MLKVGITGGIGSGKTTVCKIFELLDVPTYYADTEAKKLLNFNTEIKQSVVKEFGTGILNKEGFIDRPMLASLVFNNKEKLQLLNNIIHPAVAADFENWQKTHFSKKYILKEAAILFESGAHKQVDKIISVTAPLELKISRTMKRDNISEELVKQRMENQLSDEEKIKLSDYIIHNDEQKLIIPQILEIHEQLMLL